MKRGVIILIILLAIGLIYFLDQNNNFITSFTTAQSDDVEVNVDLFPLSKEIQPGDDIRVATRIDTNEDEEVDVVISYTITNNKGIMVFQKSKTLAVERTAKVTDNLMIHKTLDPGPYLVDVEVSYKDKRKVERETFNVVAEPVKITFGDKEATLLLIVLIMLIIFFILLILQHRRLKRLFKGLEREKIDVEDLMEEK